MIQNSVAAQDTLMRFLNYKRTSIDWANTWQMKFNVDKCAVMHIGHNNIQHNYTMVNQQQLLIATEEQLDLGITRTRDIKWQKQTEKSCKTNRLLRFIAPTSTIRAQNSCSHPTSPLSDPTWNMQFSSGHHIYVET